MANLRNCLSHLLLFALGYGGRCIKMRSAVDAPLWVATYTLLAAARDGRLFRNSHETNAVIVMLPGGKFSLGPRLANCTKKQFCSLTDDDTPIWHEPGGHFEETRMLTCLLLEKGHCVLDEGGALRTITSYADLFPMVGYGPPVSGCAAQRALATIWRQTCSFTDENDNPILHGQGGHFEKELRMLTLLDMVARWHRGRR